jgi:hypothetical protein
VKILLTRSKCRMEIEELPPEKEEEPQEQEPEVWQEAE